MQTNFMREVLTRIAGTKSRKPRREWRLTGPNSDTSLVSVHAIEFTTELGEKPLVVIPKEVAAQLPKSGAARVIILTADDPEDKQWRQAAYEQFARDDSPEDAVYDAYR